jgi:hypothetical protein
MKGRPFVTRRPRWCAMTGRPDANGTTSDGLMRIKVPTRKKTQTRTYGTNAIHLKDS